MKYILYDIESKDFFETLGALNVNEYTLINAAAPVAKCTGCFKCWLKNPGTCAFSDKMQHIGTKLLNSHEIIIICKGLYGGFSANIKRIIDRVIPGVLPFFVKKNKELHHKQRYKNNPEIKVIFYNGDEMSEKEREQAENLISAVALNFHSEKHQVVFAGCPQDAIKEVQTWTC
ncbi:MAG: flavodoxin family protein [Oscillospiraceae bacterium]|nr:flavodoxin family protein [Oscillospiraceae bacterium]